LFFFVPELDKVWSMMIRPPPALMPSVLNSRGISPWDFAPRNPRFGAGRPGAFCSFAAVDLGCFAVRFERPLHLPAGVPGEVEKKSKTRATPGLDKRILAAINGGDESGVCFRSARTFSAAIVCGS
jgi:hypothetical protein